VDAPRIVTEGLDTYVRQGAKPALDAWLRGWSATDDSTARATLAPAFVQLEGVAGKNVGYEVVGCVSWGAHTRRLYVSLLQEKRPVYMRFDAYEPPSGWRVLNITWNLDPGEIFPPGMLTPRGAQ
jgi:hypothetical protein